ncbi:MAG: Dps family protein [Pseudomonadota bacterium]|jgi:starvation-inducible DNA-binding protein
MADKTAAGLSKLLADTYAVYLKTHGYHWNVRGPNFGSLHALFMTQYTEMWTAIDEIAERVRALGELAPQGYAAFDKLSDIKDGDPSKDWQAMLKELIKDHKTLIATAKAAREGADDVSAAVIDARVQAHEKHAWMLRSTLG